LQSSGASTSRPGAGSTCRSPVRFAIELGVFVIAAIALWAAGQETLAIVLAAAALVSGVLNYLWGEASLGLERPPGPPG